MSEGLSLLRAVVVAIHDREHHTPPSRRRLGVEVATEIIDKIDGLALAACRSQKTGATQ